MIKRIAHIGIAASNLEDARQVFETLLDLPSSEVERIEEQKVDVSSIQVDDTNIEITSGFSENSPITTFIEKRGAGIHHIAFEVDDIVAELQRLKLAGVRLIDETPRVGADNYLVAFIHPKSACGVLLELCQKAG